MTSSIVIGERVGDDVRDRLGVAEREAEVALHMPLIQRQYCSA